MPVEKSIYAAPTGIEALAAENPVDVEIEVEIIDPEVEDPTFPEDESAVKPEEFDANLAEFMSDADLGLLSTELTAYYETDERDRKEWLDTYVKGLKLLGMKYEETTEPWKGASGVFHPLLAESAVRFQSETIMETFPAAGPVKTVIVGKETPAKKEAAVRVADDMNYQLTEKMPEYRPEHERMLLALSLAGNSFKKIYFDPSLNRQTSIYVPAEDLVVPYGATSLWSAERVTHRMRKTKNELRKLQVSGFYRDIDLGEPSRVLDAVERERAKENGTTPTQDARYELLEMHVDLDLTGYEDKDEDGDETGIALPYVVTIEKGSGSILAIRRNWLEDDDLKLRRQHFVHYGYVPGFGFYYFGLIHLIGGHTQAATSLMRQLIDAGTLSNLPGGLKARGMRVKNEDDPIGPGEFRDVDLPAGSIRDNILPLPYKEPSQTLLALMDKVIEDGRRFAATADLKVSDMSAQSPVGTTLAILERMLKVMSAVQARIHTAMKQEFKLIAAIIRDHTPDDYDYEPEEGTPAAKRADYDMVDILPVSDPNAATMSQKVVQYQAVHQLSSTAPQIYDLPYLHRQMIETLGVKNANKIVPIPADMKPADPITENMRMLTGKPVKAFPIQDHDAHIAVHMTFLQNPKIAAMVGQTPQAQEIQGAVMAHVLEHVAFQYRKNIEMQLGAALPPVPMDDDDDSVKPLPPAMEAQLAQLVAAASQQLLQKDTAEAQAQQAQQQQQDPLYQLQVKELEIKQAENERKKQKDILDTAIKAYEIETREQSEGEKLELEGAKIGIEVGKTQETIAAQAARDQQKLSVDLFSKIAEMSNDDEDEDKNEGESPAKSPTAKE